MAEFDRQAARERCKKACPGPWRVNRERTVVTNMSHPLCEVSERWHRECADANGRRFIGEDAEFIAHARTDLPAALDLLDEKDKEIAELRDELRIGNKLCADLTETVNAKDAEIARLHATLAKWIPDPRDMSGWDDPCRPPETEFAIREACEFHGLALPEDMGGDSQEPEHGE